MGSRRGDQLWSSWRQSPGFQQPARGLGIRQPCSRRPGRDTRTGGAAPARGAAGSRAAGYSSAPGSIDLVDLRESLRALMWRRVGITRDQAGLKEASDNVDHWCRYILPLEFDDVSGWTMQNMLLVARLMITMASLRQESRGVHYRRDFPETDPTMNKHFSLRASIGASTDIGSHREGEQAMR